MTSIRASIAATIFLALAGSLLPVSVALAAHGFLDRYDTGERHFEEMEIGENIVVYYHQRMIGEALVEMLCPVARRRRGQP